MIGTHASCLSRFGTLNPVEVDRGTAAVNRVPTTFQETVMSETSITVVPTTGEAVVGSVAKPPLGALWSK